jgi:hypothetical protein
MVLKHLLYSLLGVLGVQHGHFEFIDFTRVAVFDGQHGVGEGGLCYRVEGEALVCGLVGG